MSDLIRRFPTHAPTTADRNEVAIGEVIRAMARLGNPSILFRIREDRQVLSFRTPTHPTITRLHVTFDRIAGSTVLTKAMFGHSVSLQVVAEQQQRLSHPAALLHAASLQHGPAWEQDDVRVTQEQSSTLASVRIALGPEQLRPSGTDPAASLLEVMASAIDTLSAALNAHAQARLRAHGASDAARS